MKWFKSNSDEKLTQLLKNSGGEFRFDPEKVKYRLLASIDQADQKPVRHFRLNRVIAYSGSFAGFVIILSVTFAFASSSKPGDKLFALNKLGEQMILNLPLSADQKAKVETYIVTNRLEALDQVKTKSEVKKLEAVKESDESITKAINSVTAQKKSLEASGKTLAAKKLETVLDNLQTIAGKQEASIQEIENKTTDKAAKLKIQKHLEQIKASRLKARLEIKRFQDNKD